MAKEETNRRFSRGTEVDQWTHHTLGQVTVSAQYPQHISISFAIFKKGHALKLAVQVRVFLLSKRRGVLPKVWTAQVHPLSSSVMLTCLLQKHQTTVNKVIWLRSNCNNSSVTWVFKYSIGTQYELMYSSVRWVGDGMPYGWEWPTRFESDPQPFAHVFTSFSPSNFLSFLHCYCQ